MILRLVFSECPWEVKKKRLGSKGGGLKTLTRKLFTCMKLMMGSGHTLFTKALFNGDRS